MILLNITLLLIGFVCLIKGADFFVEGSSALARIFHVSETIIGLTIVASGTSAPELAVSTVAAMNGSNEIAISNVIGSNSFNLLCVLGVCSVIKALPVDADIICRDYPISIIATAAVMLMIGLPDPDLSMQDLSRTYVGTVGRPASILLLIAFAGYITFLVIKSQRTSTEKKDTDDMPLYKCIPLILIGIAMIISGGQLVVVNAKEIARILGMSETLIGLTIVAVGTSLPELVTSIVAAKKGMIGMAVGNVVGSNIFNLLFILGVSATIHPIAVNLASVYDLRFLLFISCMTFAFALFSGCIRRFEGILMIAVYVADIIWAILR